MLGPALFLLLPSLATKQSICCDRAWYYCYYYGAGVRCPDDSKIFQFEFRCAVHGRELIGFDWLNTSTKVYSGASVLFREDARATTSGRSDITLRSRTHFFVSLLPFLYIYLRFLVNFNIKKKGKQWTNCFRTKENFRFQSLTCLWLHIS